MIIIYQRIEDLKEKIILFRPSYDHTGNVTELFLCEKERIRKVYDRRTILYVRQSLARSYNLDLSAQGKELERKFNRKFPLPIYLPDGRVFIPLKMRKPVIIGDNTYGYVDLNFIKSVRKVNGQTLLKLTTEEEIPIYSSSSSAYNSINLGKDTIQYMTSRTNDEQEMILDALGILINKIYRIEKILDKF